MGTTYGSPSCIEAPRRLRTMHEGGYINYAVSQITSFPGMYDKQVRSVPAASNITCRSRARVAMT
jgi:hypothetical protein